MRWLIRCLWLSLLIPSMVLAAPDAQLKLPNFDALADKATESVSITLDESLLKAAARFLSSDDPKDAEAKKLMQGLRGIYVKSYTFSDAFEYPKAEVEAIRKQVSNPGWTQLMEVRSSKEQAHVGIYMSLDGSGKANGLVVIATEPREFTIVNIVGAIDLDELKKLEGKFGIPKLALESKQDAKQEVKKPDPKKPDAKKPETKK